MSLYQVQWAFRYLPQVLTVFTQVNHSHKVQKVCHYTKWSGYSKIMSLYQVEWVFRYLPQVLTVFTKVNHSQKVQNYVIIPIRLCISIPTLGPYSFTKIQLSPSSTKHVILPSGLCIQISSLGPYSFQKHIAQS